MAYSLCGKSVANTGELACDKSRGVLKKILITNGAISESDYADELTFINKLIANSKLSKDDSDKVFPINEAQDLADASEANKEGSLNLGFKTVLLEGKPAYTVKLFAGGDLLKRLRKFNNQTVRIIEYDANNVFWGTKSGTTFKGFQAKLSFTGNKIATGQGVEEGVVTLTISILSTSEYFDNVYWIESAGNVEDIKALMDVTMNVISNASNVYKIGLGIIGSDLKGAYDIWGDYGAEIAATTFTAKTGTGFATDLAVTSVAADDTLGALTVTFDTTAYAALANGAKIQLIPPTPTVLDGADVPDTEILPLIITKAA